MEIDVQNLCLRTNLITEINDRLNLPFLTELDLYDNQIEKIQGLDALENLEILDFSHNRIRKIEGKSGTTLLMFSCFRFGQSAQTEAHLPCAQQDFGHRRPGKPPGT